MERIQRWLRLPEAALFRQSLEARWHLFVLEAGAALAREAADAALPAAPGPTAYGDEARTKAAVAAMMQTTLQVLAVYASSGDPDPPVAADLLLFRLTLAAPAA